MDWNPPLLASKDDVEAILRRDLTSEEALAVESMLAKASGAFRREAQQLFTPDESEVRLRVTAGVTYLPQRPVIEVLSVRDDDGHPIEHEQHGQRLTTCLASDRFVTVRYSHGGPVPDEVRVTVAEVAVKVLSIPATAQVGVERHTRTAGPFTDTFEYAAWALGGSTELSPADRALARSYRFRAPRAHVQGSR